MSNLRKIFHQYVKQLDSFLKLHGFTRSGYSFYLTDKPNIAMVNLQLSKDSSSELLRFTLNIGVYSRSLGLFFDDEILDKPSIYKSHWLKRIGHFLPKKSDKWFEISERSSVEHITQEIKFVFNEYILPELWQNIYDEGLENLWQLDEASYVTEFQRLLYLSVFLCKRQAPEASHVIAKLIDYAKQKELSIDYHLKELNTEYGCTF